MQPPKPNPSFVSRNLVTIVMVPTIIAAHWGWNAMQNNRSLVQEHEQIDLPVVTFAKFVWRKINGEETATTKKE
ncbi:uncharacterized protein LOC133329985 [Musca vetustissima]|uniref:uncharacterized protein LOC133329985 n=1 Tax=Musca vetustissima TaxID=27455 RepID=UPI002AB661E9|nr:uncharacterized protein LOC133329985 [Musca vetustissima]